MAIGDARYVALTTYRRDRRPVTTPVWAVGLGGKLHVVTAESTGKARRVRTTGRVCLVQDEARRREALAALQRKYGWQLHLAMLVYRLRGFCRERVVLELTPSAAT
ncbi:MAG TPA: pyridoxamine 5'-phosphate oxidase family protein [Methylomirabilota bacterium]|nr:pyridoxamine 5'-phosphate oxidase family protein [Methylomirabilota bacterium]